MRKVKDIIMATMAEMENEGIIASHGYNDIYMENVIEGNEETPRGVLYCITNRTIDISLGTWREKANVMVLFLETPQQDQNGEESELVIERMMDVARVFISKLINNNEVEIDGDEIPCYSFYSNGDAGATGVRLVFDVFGNEIQCL